MATASSYDESFAAMTEETLRIYPCYETSWQGAEFPFRARLHGAMSAEALRDYFFAQCRYGNRGDMPETIEDGAESILARDRIILGGGLVLTCGSFLFYPGCCSGIETWSDWRSIAKGENSPWMGHDPDAWVDTDGDMAVFHPDIGEDVKTAKFHYEDIQAALDVAEEDLRGFLSALEGWLSREGVGRAADVAEKIREAYRIPKQGAR